MADDLIYGIDVSHNNGTIDWVKVKNASPPNSFVFIKATEGVGYVDPMCATNAGGVSSQTDMRFGYYHFASLNNTLDVSGDATSEANWFVQTMNTMPAASIIPVLDIESNASKLSRQQVEQWITAFMGQMATLGYPQVLLYSYVSFLNDNLPSDHPFGGIPLWIAHYTSNASPTIPNGWTTYTLWQYTGSGSVSGVSTVCDMNKGSASAWTIITPGQSSGSAPVLNSGHGSGANPLSFPRPNTHSSSSSVPNTSSSPNTSSNPQSGSNPHQPGHQPFRPIHHDEPGHPPKKRGFTFFGIVLGKAFFFGIIIGRSEKIMEE